MELIERRRDLLAEIRRMKEEMNDFLFGDLDHYPR
jgi:hypothetical protein